jgi:hypothetical protein
MFYSETIDELNREFNDIGDENNHYCMMYQDMIPNGVYEGKKECLYYTEKEK